jgi:hypothetical protein
VVTNRSEVTAMSLTVHTRKRTAHARTNPVPFHERLYSPKKEASRHVGIGIRKLNQMLSEGRVDSVVIDSRRYVVVESLLRVMRAGTNKTLPEPVQLQRSATTKQEVQP